MIEIRDIRKAYDGFTAVDGLSMTMKEGEVFGLVGTNGAGKTTLLRMMAGILAPDEGEIAVDGLPVYDNPRAKELFFFISDDMYYFPNSRVLLGLASRTKYLFCDETFDGLDPVMRQATKSLMAQEMDDRGLTTVMTSHNLRELEDICDHVGLLHKGGVLLSKDIADLKIGVQKLQAVFADEAQRGQAEDGLVILDHKTQGRLHVYTVRQTAEEVDEVFAGIDTVLYEILPLTLEEIFISETEVVGYDIQKIIYG